MIVPYEWRLRLGVEIVGPAPRVQMLYNSAVYFPEDAVWEWKDAAGDWRVHLSLGEWRDTLIFVRQGFSPNERGEREVSVEDKSLFVNFDTFHRANVGPRQKLLKQLTGLKTVQNLQCNALNQYKNKHPDWRKRILEKREATVKRKIAEIEEKLKERL